MGYTSSGGDSSTLTLADGNEDEVIEGQIELRSFIQRLKTGKMDTTAEHKRLGFKFRR